MMGDSDDEPPSAVPAGKAGEGGVDTGESGTVISNVPLPNNHVVDDAGNDQQEKQQGQANQPKRAEPLTSRMETSQEHEDNASCDVNKDDSTNDAEKTVRSSVGTTVTAGTSSSSLASRQETSEITNTDSNKFRHDNPDALMDIDESARSSLTDGDRCYDNDDYDITRRPKSEEFTCSMPLSFRPSTRLNRSLSNPTTSMDLRKLPVNENIMPDGSFHSGVFFEDDSMWEEPTDLEGGPALPRTQSETYQQGKSSSSSGGGTPNFVKYSQHTSSSDATRRAQNLTGQLLPSQPSERSRASTTTSSTGSAVISATSIFCCQWCRRIPDLPGMLLRRTCLHSKFSLRTQLMLSFGLVSAFTIGLVMLVCCVASLMAGRHITSLNGGSLETLAQRVQGTTVRYIAETLAVQLTPNHLVEILQQSVLERLVGYPDHPGYANDTLTPYWDMDSQRNMYPVIGPRAVLDFTQEMQQSSIHLLASDEEIQEHVQDRYSYYAPFNVVSTAYASWAFQGVCDPAITDPTHFAYFPNCTDANNDFATGGKLQPVTTNQLLHEKMSDLTPLLKSLYEGHGDIRDLGVGFMNDGAGAMMIFPGYEFSSQNSYVSAGCDWMNEPNPFKPEQPIGTPDQIGRCHPEGTVVNSREYNPLERAWCRGQALSPETPQIIGPFAEAFGATRYVMLSGKAVYDPLTREFVACTFVDYPVDKVQEILQKSTITNYSQVVLVRNDEVGTVIASSAWNHTFKPASPVGVAELDLGFSQADYYDLSSLVDYDAEWDPESVREAYEAFHPGHNTNDVHHHDSVFLVTAYPMPPPPDVYDPTYRPSFFAIVSLSREEFYKEADIIMSTVQDKVNGLVILTLLVGLIGLSIVIGLIFTVSHVLTAPLKNMNVAAAAIVKHFGGNSDEGINLEKKKEEAFEVKCVSQTELTEVVQEFQRMVKKFSGTSKMAKTVQVNYAEMENRFSLFDEFQQLYNRRSAPDFKYKYVRPEDSFRGKFNVLSNGQNTMTRKHFGSNLNMSNPYQSKKSRLSDDKKPKGRNSTLLLWIVLFIVVPMLITTITISVVVTVTVSSELLDVMDDGKDQFVGMENFSLKTSARLRADLISATIRRSTRDLHVVNRYASWLLFGGLSRSNSFSELTSGAEECKSFDNPYDCDYIQDYPCDCEWVSGTEKCKTYSLDFRYSQKPYFSCESIDTLPNGDRPSSPSFPDFSYSPATTGWWHDFNTVPGSQKGSLASGYTTTYDRLRALSAIPVFQTLYNYDRDKSHVLRTGVAMEADGLLVGYHGCSLMNDALVAFWESVRTSNSASYRPELCPPGKFGLDSRCLEWYDAGRTGFLERNAIQYASPPYEALAEREVIAQTVTSPLVDPFTSEHVGQVFVDFRPHRSFGSLDGSQTELGERGFPIVVDAQLNDTGSDAILGPNFDVSYNESMPIVELVLPLDWICAADQQCENVASFEAVVNAMKSGVNDVSEFYRSTLEGTTETLVAAYAPVMAKSLRPVDSSNFARGTNSTTYVLYSIGLFKPELEVLAPFEASETLIRTRIGNVIAVLTTTIIVATIVVVYISYRVTISITEPMVYLLQLIRHINRLDESDVALDFDITSGSSEVANVANTMRMLHKIVFCANTAFFAGEIEKSFAVLSEAARLFKRLNNTKAVGVASNNLGNTMLAVYRMMESTQVDTFLGLSRQEIIKKGMKFYHQAIKLGEAAYEEFYEAEGWSPNCLEFMQHLANRYFNRAMFLLTVKDSHEAPDDLKEQGIRDLTIARDMDVEIVDQGTEVGWNDNSADRVFNVRLNRARGHLLLLEMGYDDEWELEELLDEAFESLAAELQREFSELFQELSPAGRMQQIETELMRYKMLKGDVDSACAIAIRVLVEDEFALADAQIQAIEVLLSHPSIADAFGQEKLELRTKLLKLKLQLMRDKAECDMNRDEDEDNTEKEVSIVMRKSMKKFRETVASDVPVNEFINEDVSPRRTLLEATRGDVTMEVF